MTTTEVDTGTRVRTYGGWRRTRGLGLFGLGPVATIVVLGCVVVPLVIEPHY